MSMWPRRLGISPSSVVAHGLGRCCMIWSAAARDAAVCYLVMQMTAAWECGNRCLVLLEAVLQVFITRMASCCVVVLWYLQRDIVKTPEVSLDDSLKLLLGDLVFDFLKLNLKRAVLRGFRWLVGNWHRLCWVCCCDWLNSTPAAGWW